MFGCLLFTCLLIAFVWLILLLLFVSYCDMGLFVICLLACLLELFVLLYIACVSVFGCCLVVTYVYLSDLNVSFMVVVWIVV